MSTRARKRLTRPLVTVVAALLVACAPTGSEGTNGAAKAGPAAGPEAVASGGGMMADPHQDAGDGAAATGGEETLATSEIHAAVLGPRATLEMAVPEAFPESLAGEGRLGLVMEGIEFGRPGIYYDVYAGLPAGAPADPEGPYYAGTLSSFGPADEKTAVSFDVTRVIETLQAEGRWSGKLVLTLIRRGLEPPADQPDLETIPAEPRPVRIDRVSLVRFEDG